MGNLAGRCLQDLTSRWCLYPYGTGANTQAGAGEECFFIWEALDMDLFEKKLEFLYKALEDAQSTIRFIDTKTSITTFAVGLIVAMITSGLADFSDYFWNMTCILQWLATVILFVAYLASALTIHTAIQVVYPKSNPSEHVQKSTQTKELFYLHRLDKLDGKIQIRPGFEQYLAEFNTIQNPEELQSILVYELLKVSYIRESKIADVKRMKRFLYVVLVALLPLMAIHFWGLSHYKMEAHPRAIHCDIVND